MVSIEDMTHEQKMYVKNIELYEPYKYMDTQQSNVRLLNEKLGKTLTLSKINLKFLVDNKLINIKDFKLTSSGEIIRQEGYELLADKVEILRIRKEIDEENKEKAKQLVEQQNQQIQIEQHNRQLEEQRRAKSFVSCITGLFKDFEKPSKVCLDRKSNRHKVDETPVATNNNDAQVNNVVIQRQEEVAIQHNDPNMSISLNNTQDRKSRLQDIMSAHN